MSFTDTYKTISSPSIEVLYKDKNSKFYGYSFPVNNEAEIKNYLKKLRKEHYSARHWCYAWQLGIETIRYRVNDDGEPNNTAGQPIYGQIQSFNVTNVLVVIVRYFGGIKLGVGGLINAYRNAAQMSLESSKIIEKTINIEYLLSFDYKNMNKVMRVIKERKVNIINQQLEMNCKIEISVRKKDSEKIFNIFNSIFGITIKKVSD